MFAPARVSPAVWVAIAVVAISAAAGVHYLTGRSNVARVENPPSPERPIEASGISPDRVREPGAASAHAVPTVEGESRVAETGLAVRARVPASRSGSDGPGASAESLSSPTGAGPPAGATSGMVAESRTTSHRPAAIDGPVGASAAAPRETAPVGSATESAGGTYAAVSAPSSGAGSVSPEADRGGRVPGSTAGARQDAPVSSSHEPPQNGRSDAPPPTSVPRVVMVPSASRVAVGDLVSLLIAIDGAENVGHTPFHVRFNPSVLRFVSAAEGSFLGSDGQPTAFFASPTADGASVVVGLSRLGRVGGVSGGGELCILHFEVVGPGAAGLAFSRAKVRDSSNAIVSASFLPASVTAADGS